MGKSTIMYQKISDLLMYNDSKNILYFSFDKLRHSLQDIMDTYQNLVLNKTFENTQTDRF